MFQTCKNKIGIKYSLKNRIYIYKENIGLVNECSILTNTHGQHGSQQVPTGLEESHYVMV